MIRLLFIIFVAATVLCSSCDTQKGETQKCEWEKGDTCVTQKGDRARNNLKTNKNAT